MAKAIRLKDVPKLVRESRAQHGLTQTQLAEYAHVSFDFVSRVENDDTNVRINTLNKLLAVFGYEIAAVLKEAE